MSEIAGGGRSALRSVRPDAYEPMPPALYVYRQSTPHGEHTGIVCDVTPEAFLDGRVLGHESVQPERVDGLARYLATMPQRVELVSTLHRAGPVVASHAGAGARAAAGPRRRRARRRAPHGVADPARPAGRGAVPRAGRRHPLHRRRAPPGGRQPRRCGPAPDGTPAAACCAWPTRSTGCGWPPSTGGWRARSTPRWCASLLEASFDVRPVADAQEALATGIAVNLDRRWYVATLFRRATARVTGPGRLAAPRPRARPAARGHRRWSDPGLDRGSPRGVRRRRRGAVRAARTETRNPHRDRRRRPGGTGQEHILLTQTRLRHLPAHSRLLTPRTNDDLDWLNDTPGYYITETTAEHGRRSFLPALPPFDLRGYWARRRDEDPSDAPLTASVHRAQHGAGSWTEEARLDDRRGRRSQRVTIGPLWGWAEALPRLSDQKARPAAGWASPRHGRQANDASAPSPSGGRGAASASAPWAAWR